MLQIEGVTKRFGSVVAVADVSATIEKGEFFALLGPSGCGKTTLLRTIAGIYRAEGGTIALDGQAIGERPISARDIALVFQNYALFPHLSVFENVAFGLRMRRLPRREIATRVEEVLDLVRLRDLARRRPGELSGGQQQRVALARAIVVRPRLLLLDEPLSNLDAKLRDEMRDEIRALQRRLALTTVLVTHDLREAFAVSDRVGVMRDGRLEQVGTPWEVYDAPQSRFVAAFVGHANILSGAVTAVGDGAVTIRTDAGLTLVAVRGGLDWRPGARAWATLRPERLRLDPGADAANRFETTVADVTYLGNAVTLRLEAGGTTLRAQTTYVGQALPAAGARVAVGCGSGDLVARPDEARAD
ncbi:MAG: ABC transporter ATP-binding protein [Rhodobacteraceae bacterium]|nr:ABC transporter ATP-binding protein [Paracoccaceae bacterium]